MLFSESYDVISTEEQPSQGCAFRTDQSDEHRMGVLVLKVVSIWFSYGHGHVFPDWIKILTSEVRPMQG